MVATLEFRLDSSQLQKLEAFCLAASGKLKRVNAVAMTRSAKASQAKLKQVAPTYINQPTP